MVGTQVTLAPELPSDNVVVRDASIIWPVNGLHGGESAFLAHQMLVLDGYDWGPALVTIQERGLDPKPRAFKDPYIERKTSPEVQQAVASVMRQAKGLYPLLYPWPATMAHSSFRPMVTGPEPLHYDSYDGGQPLVTAYINVSTVPRVYRISWNFEQLCRRYPAEVRKAWRECAKPGDDASYPIRMRTQNGKGPLGPDVPRHTVHMAPGAIWFFNAKTVSHEVVHGTGAIGIGWEVPTSGAKLQRDILKEFCA